MKKFAILLTLIAAFAVAGCGSDDKPATAPAQIPQAAPAKPVNFKPSKNVVKTETLPDGSIQETTNKGSLIITHPDGTKTYKSGNKVQIPTKGDGSIHHFSK